MENDHLKFTASCLLQREVLFFQLEHIFKIKLQKIILVDGKNLILLFALST